MGGFTTGGMPVFMMSLYCWVCYKLIVKSKQFNKVEQPALVYPSLTLIFNTATINLFALFIQLLKLQTYLLLLSNREQMKYFNKYKQPNKANKQVRPKRILNMQEDLVSPRIICY